MDWYKATEKCEELGGQLPPRWLLCAIYDDPELKKIKNLFEAGYYWSSTENSETLARYVNFTSGSTYTYNKTDALYVRCVREFK